MKDKHVVDTLTAYTLLYACRPNLVNRTKYPPWLCDLMVSILYMITQHLCMSYMACFHRRQLQLQK
jgi:hypothetical protein